MSDKTDNLKKTFVSLIFSIGFYTLFLSLTNIFDITANSSIGRLVQLLAVFVFPLIILFMLVRGILE